MNTTLTGQQVHTTKDYFLFSSIDGNRSINQIHVKRLEQSMQTKYLATIIIVNEKHQIIDGQHRFEVIQKLNLPVNYVVCEGYGLDEVHILNQNSKTWSSGDFMNGYCDLGIPHYITFREFRNAYRLGYFESMVLLSGVNSHLLKRKFVDGEFEVSDYDSACIIAEKIIMVEPIYLGARRRSFVLAMIQLLKNPKFNYSEFLTKLKRQQSELVDCTTVSKYIELIERIYNYRRQNKVNLRF